ncbi:hypothetical protein [Oceanobacillus halophilus]|uniref:DUF4468 domain-containing protein n=1 Tax=Oceanobacillus halophilus TaxID=930130 RepID=A0A495A5M0_9BACI|nr:hypothetical protein [Oceanobacillus halophilus]RKQ34660.1 hypothetical protein D8M06_06985 [Oceanobacillus halophilus]
MKKRSFKLFAITLFSSLLLLFGCTENTETETQDKNIQTMEAVLKNNLTGPSDELQQILKEKEWMERLRKYEEKLYKDYFADDASYVAFVGSYGSVLMNEPMRNNYKLKVKNIDFEKTDSEEIIYNFSVELHYQKEGSENTEVEIVTGQANLNEDHKIENMLIRIGDFLGSLSN